MWYVCSVYGVGCLIMCDVCVHVRYVWWVYMGICVVGVCVACVVWYV